MGGWFAIGFLFSLVLLISLLGYWKRNDDEMVKRLKKSEYAALTRHLWFH